ncbi:hypothetical protein QO002_005535 [Pararhizobium capsulatum DSM 1112]|uniref:Uncharacterized protein n=1 Tax=Pararhizobium capsulatum DSM 1112 TaxID=1121113 RepID=A0ABU0BYK3_9HYPH|nr:hypothetical protein [Pararhizobium capsulatum]MDQ0323329.1 hypothetical protein [Pararhizobium capsulatum DSM 1112]
MKPSIILTGTAREEPAKRVLKAGALEATFDAGALRWIRWNGVEILRGISFLVRTPGWGTPLPVISDLHFDEQDAGLHVRYDAYFGEAGEGVLAKISFTARAEGHLEAAADIRADAAFSTNRTGFVILHPLLGFAGTQIEVEHASGLVRKLNIPLEISPGQPVLDIQAIAHWPHAGLRVSARFAGDIFEMEDHRNWSDASFKTYSRPIGLPYPYLLNPAVPARQSVTVAIADAGMNAAVATPVSVPAFEGQLLPDYALPLDYLDDARDALRFADALVELRPARLLLRYDAARGDTVAAAADLKELLRRTGASLDVQVILSGDDPAAAGSELERLAQTFKDAGIAVSDIAAFAKIDEQSFQPGEPRPPHLTEEQLATALDATFPESRRGGGTPAFFTEFNRKRPNPERAQYLTFATTPVVHAADDASVVETLQSLPHILHSAGRLANGLPLAVGPVGIGARLSPYGPAPVDNRPDERAGMAAQDPRQRGLFAAAWHVGYLAQIAPWGIDRFAFGAPTGPFGLVSSRQSFAREDWDHRPDGAIYPLYHVARWISEAAGGKVVSAGIDGHLAHVTWEKDGYRKALFANLSAEPVAIALSGKTKVTGYLMDEESFEVAALDRGAFHTPQPFADAVHMGAYGVLHLDYGKTQ